ncbi:uncharacterized protein LOC108440896 isoform X1 [Pygocentrus nattereri]|uniref:uncharacterized protein LOC108440896 isoform X1 n=1 Tax=Pygocentrus nattereri TaxID=42514 RepID=UPI001890DDC8|nr:uncharacterized protein LOC108440896 isoform X1 [Pygocentrus nattereri]
MSASEMAEQGQGNKLTKEERARLLLIKQAFPQNAFFIFNQATEFVTEADDIEGHDLLEKMLHSILFLGNINAAKYPPDVIFVDREIYDKSKKAFPKPFDRYNSHVPLRTPFSYLLELIVRYYGAHEEEEENDQEKEERVKAILCEILNGCKKSGIQYPLISSVISICHVSNRRYYGGSLTCPGEIERQIMTAVSCLHVWHSYVSSAVLGVFPEDTTEARFPEGDINLPESVVCRAYDIENLREVKPPCMLCHELYSLPEHTHNRNKPGNCAETEAISSLLKYEERVKRETTMKGSVLRKDEIKKRMSAYFDSKMNDRMSERGNRDIYDINKIYD